MLCNVKVRTYSDSRTLRLNTIFDLHNSNLMLGGLVNRGVVKS